MGAENLELRGDEEYLLADSEREVVRLSPGIMYIKSTLSVLSGF